MVNKCNCGSNPLQVAEECANLAFELEKHHTQLVQILVSVQSREASDDELFKATDLLSNVGCEQVESYFGIGPGAAFLPLNLPLYSLVLFGVMPSLFCSPMSVRPPVIMRQVVTQIMDVLGHIPLMRRLAIHESSRRDFVQSIAQRSALVSFTGRLSNVNELRPFFSPKQLILFHGQGANPVVVADDADLDLAVAKSLRVKCFNSGQDCASPDTILVHRRVVAQFTELLCQQIKELQIGQYSTGASIGPLLDHNQLLNAAEHLSHWRNNIVFGGRLSFLDGVVFPTVILSSLSDGKVNRTELFAPIWQVSEYDSDDNLIEYFEHPQYRQHAMYVSLFGTSNYLTNQTHTQVLKGKTVIEAERGYLEYGGSGMGSSFVQFNGRTDARPILISREIVKAFQ
jgi:acyl-CoA reductase-like NAD-dependent aldehyde dehydrogenase